MTELEALRRVAEAAEMLEPHIREAVAAWEAEGGDLAEGNYLLSKVLCDAVAAFRALPAPAAEPEGEVVEVRAHVRLNTMDPTIYVVEGGGNVDGTEHWARTAGVFATIRARVPLPRVPEVVWEVG